MTERPLPHEIEAALHRYMTQINLVRRKRRKGEDLADALLKQNAMGERLEELIDRYISEP